MIGSILHATYDAKGIFIGQFPGIGPVQSNHRDFIDLMDRKKFDE